MSEPIFVVPEAELPPVLSPELLPELRASALRCLLLRDPAAKVLEVAALNADFKNNTLTLDAHASLVGEAEAGAIPGRPSRPELVLPKTLKHRSMRTEEGRAALIHALAHIEFNAINLALDAVCRFPAMPDQYYTDWLSVAVEEAQHFGMLARHLQTLGFAYGDFPGHNSMWEMAEKTKDDILARMALVPRTLEARGLDATPAVRAKIAQAGDLAAAEILDIILREEVGHVAIGNHWYNWLCKERQLEPIAAFANLVVQYQAPVLRGPFNLDARRAAGFSEEELAVLQSG
ncbi:ferritin-like domain-containing protein [Glaciimonas sp. CA11.2]|uniref:ferritin-like domain-containing protein n=1 Tax=unclassified Glaciimonas TaxID=2644401 RepID=UPI002AB45B7D|nr:MULTISPECIES: ferritin-like domain-containing protein [unclassified Glaciimonas]MDY7547573.1 ferritin-like domain-containing protein [Glaciimonas sp. CA11.2]MEB0014236.1 ferritin-like domain-containing protein [Glaciimonas sp. Cout2]MEB0084028.1 ferritin-like domain-containing protein [Glaciimonas sp. Gout2]MEB0162031.1 ferritin-like domain-containing protein [Glaciimonas sp. CA11.2]